MCKISIEKKQEIFSEENRKDWKEKTKEEILFMISDVKKNPQMPTERKTELISKLMNEYEKYDKKE